VLVLAFVLDAEPLPPPHAARKVAASTRAATARTGVSVWRRRARARGEPLRSEGKGVMGKAEHPPLCRPCGFPMHRICSDERECRIALARAIRRASPLPILRRLTGNAQRSLTPARHARVVSGHRHSR
jgi:hypothetical protein